MSKHKFLAVYDYGMGGIWAFFHARTRSEITEKYPELKIMDDVPDWLNKQDKENMESHFTFDIDEPPHGWLLSLIRERERSKSKN